MYLNRNVLGGDCLIERVKRWLAGCGVDRESRVGNLERPHARRARNLHVFFPFCVLSVDRGQRPSKEEAEHAARKSHESRAIIDEKLIENR